MNGIKKLVELLIFQQKIEKKKANEKLREQKKSFFELCCDFKSCDYQPREHSCLISQEIQSLHYGYECCPTSSVVKRAEKASLVTKIVCPISEREWDAGVPDRHGQNTEPVVCLP
jgi:hypothetical protein